MTIEELTRVYGNLFKYIKNKFKNITDNMAATNEMYTKDKSELKNEIKDNKDSISNLSSNIDTLSTKVGNLESNPKVDIDGDYIQINNVKQLVIDSVNAGDTIELENKNNNSVFLIQCFAQLEEGETVTLKNIECTPENKDLFEFDERYVELTEQGLKPKTYTEIPMEKTDETEEYTIYTSTSTITEELLDNIENIIFVDGE